MSLIFLAILLSAHWSAVSAHCDACFDGSCYEKIIVLERFKQSGQLAIDRKDNIFYFHVTNSNKRPLSLAFDLTNVKLHEIVDVESSFARAVDQTTRDLYIADYGAVYKTNPKDNFEYKTEEVFRNVTVWHMQFKEKLYYVLFNTKGMRYYENGIHQEVAGLEAHEIDDFIIDRHNDIYFVSEYNLYQLKNGASTPNKISDEFYTLTTDRDGDARFTRPFIKTLYKMDEKNDELIEIGAFSTGEPYKSVFTSDNNIVYSDTKFNGMYMLVPASGKCVVSSTGSGRNVKKTISKTN